MRLASAVTAVVFALSATSSAAGQTPEPAQARESVVSDPASDQAAEQALAEKFAPVVMLVRQSEECGPGEPYQPSDVDVLFGNDTVALRGPWTTRDLVTVGPTAEQLSAGLPGYELDFPGDPLDPGCDYEKWARSQWGADARATIYAHIAREEGVADRLAVQYFFFYPFNDYNNKHEGDWERIQLEFATGDPATALSELPDLVVYAQHSGAEAARWDDGKLQVVNGTHPVVYVSAGSHASQYTEGLFLGNSGSTGFGCDTTVGDHVELQPLVRTIPSDSTQARAEYPWIGFAGHWGQVGPRDFYTGPTGPAAKSAWKAPFTWSAGARDSSFSVPGASAASSSATSFFCGAVAKGSDLFRRYASNPGPTLVVLLLALLLLVWWMRRASWHSAHHPAVQVRSAGQVLAASYGWARAHTGTFVLLAVGCVAPALVSAVLQLLPFSSAPLTWLRIGVAVLVGVALVVVAGAVAQAVLTLPQDRVGARAAYVAAAPRAGRAVVTVGLAVAVVLLLTTTVLLVPVAVVLVVAWSLVVPTVQVEGRWGIAALRRCQRLARATLGTVVPLFVACVLVATTLGLLLASVVFILFSAPFAVVDAIPALVTALTWPFVSLLVTFGYANAVATVDRAPVDVPA